MFLSVTDQSSTVLHILLRVNIYYTIFWFILEIPLYVFKYYKLPYAANTFGTEIALLFMLCFNDFLRQFFGLKGNLILKPRLLIHFIVYGFICALGFSFFIILQTYAQRVEIIIASVALALITVEMILAIITIFLNRRFIPELTDAEKLRRLQQAQRKFEATLKNE